MTRYLSITSLIEKNELPVIIITFLYSIYAINVAKNTFINEFINKNGSYDYCRKICYGGGATKLMGI